MKGVGLVVLLALFGTLLTVTVTSVKSQKVCYERNTTVPENGIIFAETFSAQKCMRIEGNKLGSNVSLDDCLYGTKMSKKQELRVSTNSFNKSTIKTNGGQGEFYCLTTSPSGILTNALCNGHITHQSWTFKPVKGYAGQFLIEQLYSRKCLKPTSLLTGAKIELTACNALKTEQIWFLYYSPLMSNTTEVVPLMSC